MGGYLSIHYFRQQYKSSCKRPFVHGVVGNRCFSATRIKPPKNNAAPHAVVRRPRSLRAYAREQLTQSQMSVGFTTRPPSWWTLSRCCRGKSGQSTTDVVGSNWRSTSRPKRTPPLLNHLPSRIPFSGRGAGADSTHFRFCITYILPFCSLFFPHSPSFPFHKTLIHNFSSSTK